MERGTEGSLLPAERPRISIAQAKTGCDGCDSIDKFARHYSQFGIEGRRSLTVPAQTAIRLFSPIPTYAVDNQTES